MRSVIREHLQPGAKVLVVGCGNSRFSADLHDDGWPDVTSIDFSAVVIETMAARHQEARPSMQWRVMDMTALTFDAGTFDAVLDKAAMDALMVDEGDPWDPDPATRQAAAAMCESVSRVLKPGGVFLQVSFAQPHFRTRFLRDWQAGAAPDAVVERFQWTVRHCTVGDSGCLETFVYICERPQHQQHQQQLPAPTEPAEAAVDGDGGGGGRERAVGVGDDASANLDEAS